MFTVHTALSSGKTYDNGSKATLNKWGTARSNNVTCLNVQCSHLTFLSLSPSITLPQPLRFHALGNSLHRDCIGSIVAYTAHTHTPSSASALPLSHTQTHTRQHTLNVKQA